MHAAGLWIFVTVLGGNCKALVGLVVVLYKSVITICLFTFSLLIALCSYILVVVLWFDFPWLVSSYVEDESGELQQLKNKLRQQKKQLGALLKQPLLPSTFSCRYPTQSGHLVLPQKCISCCVHVCTYVCEYTHMSLNVCACMWVSVLMLYGFNFDNYYVSVKNV